MKSNNKIAKHIEEFNNFLDHEQVFTTYQTRPFLNKYPLHITLYLTEYTKKQIPIIIKQAEKIASGQDKLILRANQLSKSSSGYVMLSVYKTPALQALSDTTVEALAPLRDTRAVIPQWAANDPQRKKLFIQYGSPNVSNYFNPHFSIMDPLHLTQQQQVTLSQLLQKLIMQFTDNHSIKKEALAYAIGVGEADAQGQITHEFAEFELN